MYWRAPIVVHGRLRGHQPISQPLDQYSVRHAAGLAHGLQPAAAAGIFQCGQKIGQEAAPARRVTLDRIVDRAS
jgi:hypothetical protein